MNDRLHGCGLLCRGQGQRDELSLRRRLQLARLTAPLVHKIGVQAMGQRDACYRGACLGAFAQNLCPEFVAVTTPGR